MVASVVFRAFGPRVGHEVLSDKKTRPLEPGRPKSDETVVILGGVLTGARDRLRG